MGFGLISLCGLEPFAKTIPADTSARLSLRSPCSQDHRHNFRPQKASSRNVPTDVGIYAYDFDSFSVRSPSAQ